MSPYSLFMIRDIIKALVETLGGHGRTEASPQIPEFFAKKKKNS
jgi:hypothetical protein